MSDTIDELQIEINAKAVKANDAIDRLVGKLDRLTTSLSKVNGTNLNGLANGVKRLGNAMQVMNTIKTSDFTRLATNLTRLGAVNVSALNSAASSMSHLTRAFNSLGTVSANAQAVGEMAKNIAKLGNKSVQTAITNIPQLATAMNGLMTTLSRSPMVSQNVIQMANALANLASQGSRVGTASNSIVRGLIRTSTSANTARRSFGGLASAIGKFYATYFMVIRSLKGLWSSVESTADYIEAYNYFNVALGKIGSDWSYQFEQYGYDNAEIYADSFSTRLSERLGKLSGLQVTLGADGKGLLAESGMKNLGLNIQEITQYASQLASVTNSVGQTGEVSLAAASSFTKLAGDISSLFNIDYSSVSRNLQSALIGQSRSVYKFGIDITNATLQTYAYNLGLSKSVSEMTQAEKMQLRMIAILDQSKVSWGDLANTINSPSNMIRQFKNNLKETGMVLGQLFIPILQKVLPVINGVTIAIKRLLVNIANLLGVKIDFNEFGQGYNELEDGLNGIEDGFDGVYESVKKATAGLRAFDELKVINTPSTSVTGMDESSIDLTDKILIATEEYENAWNKAFATAENKANKFAEKLTKMFKEMGVAKNFSKIVESIKKFSNAISPFAEGFGDGFLGFLGTLAKTSLKAFTISFNALVDVLDNVPPETLKKVGECFGVLVGAITTFTALTAVKKKLSWLASGLSALGTSLKEHPILGTFAISAGTLALFDKLLPKIGTDYKDEDFTNIINNFAKIEESIKEAEKAFSEENNLAVKIGDVYDKWKDLNAQVELTAGENALLKQYANYLKLYCEDADKYIDENGKSFNAVGEELDSVIEKAKTYHKILAREKYLGKLTEQKVESEFNLEETESEIDKLYAYIREKAPNLTDEQIQALIKVAKNTNFRKNAWGTAITGGLDPLAPYEFAYSLGITPNDVDEFIKKLEAVKKLGELQIVKSDQEEQLKKINKRIEEVASSLSKVNDEHKKEAGSFETLKKGGENVLTTTKNFVESTKKAFEYIKKIGENIDGLNKKKIDIPISIGKSGGGSSLNFKTIFGPDFSMKGYATGGIVSSGQVFVARENRMPEMVGRFGNQTAVANNDQIVSGIQSGVYSAMVSALSTLNTGSGETVIMIDGKEVFRAVKSAENENYRRTGNSVFVH